MVLSTAEEDLHKKGSCSKRKKIRTKDKEKKLVSLQGKHA